MVAKRTTGKGARRPKAAGLAARATAALKQEQSDQETKVLPEWEVNRAIKDVRRILEVDSIQPSAQVGSRLLFEVDGLEFSWSPYSDEDSIQLSRKCESGCGNSVAPGNISKLSDLAWTLNRGGVCRECRREQLKSAMDGIEGDDVKCLDDGHWTTVKALPWPEDEGMGEDDEGIWYELWGFDRCPYLEFGQQNWLRVRVYMGSGNWLLHADDSSSITEWILAATYGDLLTLLNQFTPLVEYARQDYERRNSQEGN